MKYTVIKSETQYKEYCDRLEHLDFCNHRNQYEDEIELLTLLIRTWDEEKYPFTDTDPVELIKSLMNDHRLTQQELSERTGVVKSTISEILNYKRPMSKDVIRKISHHFKIRQDALSKPYTLVKTSLNPQNG